MMASQADRLIHHLARLGRPGALGAALLVAALAADAVLVRAMEEEGDRLAEANERARLVRSAGERAQPAARAGAELPLSPAAEAALARLFKAAETSGLSLARGDYKLTSEAGAGYRRYQLMLPLAGRYPAIRAFLAAALDGDPALALDELRLARDEIDSDQLEATLRFTLYLTVQERSPHPCPLCAFGPSLAALGTATLLRPAPCGLVPFTGEGDAVRLRRDCSTAGEGT